MQIVDEKFRFGDVCKMVLDVEYDFALQLFEDVNSLGIRKKRMKYWCSSTSLRNISVRRTVAVLS